MTKHALDSVQHFDSGGTVIAGNQNAVGSGGIAGAVGSVLGTNNNFQATGASITPGTNAGQISDAYGNTQAGIRQANNLTTTLTPGVAQGAESQNFLTNQLTNQAQGIGPNPAQAALNQNTANNIKQAAALAAGTRGAGTNAGLIASNAAQNAANTNQEAAGQEATLQANQQLAAQGQLANLAGQQIGQGTNAIQLQNQVGQNEQNILQGANTAQNNANVSMQQNINSTNAAVAAGNQNANQNVISGIGNAVKGIASGITSLFAEGGEVPAHIHKVMSIYHPHLADGGMVWQNSIPVSAAISGGAPTVLPSYQGGPMLASLAEKPKADASPASLSPVVSNGSYYGGQGYADQLGAIGANLSIAKGGKVPGKPKVNHDAYSNDTVDAKLTPGEVVMDLDTLHDKGRLGKMARWVAANIERKKAGRHV